MKLKILNEDISEDSFDLEGRAFYDSTFRGVSDTLETDSDDELNDWVWDRCADGEFVETKNLITGEYHRYRPIDFGEDAIDTTDLLIESYEDKDGIFQLDEDDYYDIISQVQDILEDNFGVDIQLDDYYLPYDEESGAVLHIVMEDDDWFEIIDNYLDDTVDDDLIQTIADAVFRKIENGHVDYPDGMPRNMWEELSGDDIMSDSNIDNSDVMVDEDDNVVILDEANSRQMKRKQKKELARQRQALINQMKDASSKFKDVTNKLNNLDSKKLDTSDNNKDTDAKESSDDTEKPKDKSDKKVNDNKYKKILTDKNWFEVYKKSGKDFKKMRDEMKKYTPEEQEYIKKYIIQLEDNPTERLKYAKALDTVRKNYDDEDDTPSKQNYNFRKTGNNVARKINDLTNGFRSGLAKGGIHIK